MLEITKALSCEIAFRGYGISLFGLCIRLLLFPGAVAHRRGKEKVPVTQMAVVKHTFCEEQTLTLL